MVILIKPGLDGYTHFLEMPNVILSKLIKIFKCALNISRENMENFV